MRQVMITTNDNPFDPFDQFDDWYSWDTSRGYNTASYLARLAYLSLDSSDADQTFAIESAIDEIVSENITGNYVKLIRDVPDPNAHLEQAS